MPRSHLAPAHMQPAKPDALRQKPVVRGYPEGTEVLTEHGFYAFEDLMTGDLLAGEKAFEGKGLPQSWTIKDAPYQLYTPDTNFPRLATVHPLTGEVSYVPPTLFRVFTYLESLAHVKMKGVDILTTRYADLWLKNRYGRGFRFVLAENVYRNRAGNAYYQMLDKFNQDLYGEYEPRESLAVNMESPISLKPAQHTKWEKIEELYSYTSIDPATGRRIKLDRVRQEIEVYNVDVEPYHTLIIRRARKNNNPRTPWIGNPIVVGDGSDKSVMRVDGIKDLRNNR